MFQAHGIIFWLTFQANFRDPKIPIRVRLGLSFYQRSFSDTVSNRRLQLRDGSPFPDPCRIFTVKREDPDRCTGLGDSKNTSILPRSSTTSEKIFPRLDHTRSTLP